MAITERWHSTALGSRAVTIYLDDMAAITVEEVPAGAVSTTHGDNFRMFDAITFDTMLAQCREDVADSAN